MSSWFVSDLHLSADQPRLTATLIRFLRNELNPTDQLFILGDLFDAWIGDDDPSALATEVARAFRQASDRGVLISFLPGNRDFLLGDAYADRAGLRLIEDGHRLQIDGLTVALMHGDTLCTDDEDYQAFRRQVRSRQWQEAFLQRPLESRQDFAAMARRQSASATRQKPNEIMDVNRSTTRATLAAMPKVEVLIHGHTHRPATHHREHGSSLRIVLPDWHHSGGALHFVHGRFLRTTWSFKRG